MSDESGRWQAAMATIETDLRRWRAAHPAATLTEIDQALDTRLAAARADLLAEVAAATADPSPRCPACGGALVQRGRRPRTQGDAPLTLTRPYLSCPACGSGVFPPG